MTDVTEMYERARMETGNVKSGTSRGYHINRYRNQVNPGTEHGKGAREGHRENPTSEPIRNAGARTQAATRVFAQCRVGSAGETGSRKFQPPPQILPEKSFTQKGSIRESCKILMNDKQALELLANIYLYPRLTRLENFVAKHGNNIRVNYDKLYRALVAFKYGRITHPWGYV